MAFHALPDDAWDGLTAEAQGLAVFLADRDPAAYSRHARWWSQRPGGEVRVISG